MKGRNNRQNVYLPDRKNRRKKVKKDTFRKIPAGEEKWKN